MAETYIVGEGEHLSGIAADHGFSDFHTIWDDPQNAGLKAIRDPHVLFPGDELFIPDPKTKTENGSTGKVHLFELSTAPLFLRLRVQDMDARPVLNTPCDLHVELNDAASKNTDKAGLVAPDEQIDPKAGVGELIVHLQRPPANDGDPPPPEQTLKFDLKIGALNPEIKLSGQQARLNNLGYFAGFTLDDLEQLLWAAEEFECDRIHKSQARVIQRPALAAVLPEDRKDGKELGAPDRETGILDGKLRTELKKFHGC
jgi:hypothetical protein